MALHVKQRLLLAPDGSTAFDSSVLQSCAVAEVAIDGFVVARTFFSELQCVSLNGANQASALFHSKQAGSSWVLGGRKLAAAKSTGGRGAEVSGFMECAVLDEVRIWSTHRDDVSMQDFYTGGLRTTARLADALHPSVREAVEAEEAHRIGSIPAALRAMARPGTARGRSLNEAEVTPAMLAPSLRTPSRFAMPSSDLNVWARVQLRQHQVRSLPVFASEGVTSRVRWLGSAGA